MIVLDTHIWVNWIVGGNNALPKAVVAAMDAESRLAISAISCFEVALLVKRGKLEFPLPVAEWIIEATVNSGVESLPISCEIANKSVVIADVHRDPADRIIIATALVHNAKLASIDSVFPGYTELQDRLIGDK
jgi:PIN domain nuclease of toxin-antitoxin system